MKLEELDVEQRLKVAEKKFRQLMVELSRFAPGPFTKNSEFDWEARGVSKTAADDANRQYIHVKRSAGNVGLHARVVAVLKPAKAQELFNLVKRIHDSARNRPFGASELSKISDAGRSVAGLDLQKVEFTNHLD